MWKPFKNPVKIAQNFTWFSHRFHRIVKNNKTYNPRECTRWIMRREWVFSQGHRENSWVERRELGLRKSRLWGKTVTRGALHPHNTSHREDKWYLFNIRCSFWFSIIASWTGSAMTSTKEPRTSSNSMAASKMYAVPTRTKKSSLPSEDFVTLSGVILLRYTLSQKYLRVPTSLSLRGSALYINDQTQAANGY